MSSVTEEKELCCCYTEGFLDNELEHKMIMEWTTAESARAAYRSWHLHREMTYSPRKENFRGAWTPLFKC